MLCYKDMTYCDFYKQCLTGEGCDRALTKEIEAKAISKGLPICHFLEKPICFCNKITGIGAKIS